MKIFIAITNILCAVFLNFGLNDDGFAQTWMVVPSPSPDTGRNILRGVGAISSNDVWAVGAYGQIPEHSLIEHWNGVNWTIISSPNPGINYNELWAVRGTATNNVYAVGSYSDFGTPQMMVFRWNGSTWSQQSTPTVTGGSGLENMFIVGPNDIYAGGYKTVGAPGPTTGTLVVHYNGSSWEIESTPHQANRTNRITDIRAFSTTDVWACGYSRNLGENFQSMLLHKTGGTWNLVSVTAPGQENFLYSIDIISPNDIWATGYYNDNGTLFPLFIHYNGSSWTVVNSPGGGFGTVHNAPNDIWSTGSEFAHYDGTNWSNVTAPVPIGGAMGSSARISSTDIWSVGRYIDGDALKTLTMHFGPSALSLNIKLLIQGFYEPSLNKMTKDTVKIYLRNSAAPYGIVDSSVNVIDSTGSGNFSFPNAVSSVPYYIVVKHRNGLDTWSSSAKVFNSGTLNYDFTISASQAFGNNEILKGSKYCIYNGDLNHDGVINMTDIVSIHNNATGFVNGYVSTDLTGDNITNVTDILVAYNNSVSFVQLRRP